MKAIKKSVDNLVSVAKLICDVDFYSGRFYSDSDFKVYQDCDVSLILYSKRDSIGTAVFSMIPCNYSYRVTFESANLLRLCIWYEKR